MAILKRSSILLTIFCLGILILLGTMVPTRVQAEPSACVAGPHSGFITSNQTWCLIDSPHLVTGGVEVNPGVTLTIEAGVIVNYNSSTYLRIDGTLVAQGSQLQYVIFTSNAGVPAPGDWIGLQFMGSSTANLSYIKVAYAGQNDSRAVFVGPGSNFQLHDSRVHHSSGHGIWLDGQANNATLGNVEIDHNNNFAIYQTTVDMNPSYTNINIHDNGGDMLAIYGDYMHRDITLDGSPAALNGAPIVFSGQTIKTGAHVLTVTPGTTIKFGASLGIQVENGGTFNAPGTQLLPITLTSSSGSPAPGDWNAIEALGGSTVNLSHIDVSDAGAGGDPRAFWVVTTSNFQIHHSRIHNNAGQGIRLDGQALTATLDDLEIDHNGGVAILETTMDMTPTYNNIRMHDNGLNALQVNGDYMNRDITLDGSPTALNGAPIVVSGQLIKTNNHILTITPGTTIKFTASLGIQTNNGGTFNAIGTQALPIVFTSAAANPAPGDWSTLEALYGSTVSLSHIDVSDAAANGRAFWVVAGANFQIHSSHIHHNLGRGFWLEGNGLTATLDDLEIDHNTTDAILETTMDMTPTYNNIRMHDNGLNALLVNGDYMHRDVTLDGSPTALNGAPIVVSGQIIRTNNHILTITPGTTIKFTASLGIQTNDSGTFNAIGTQALPIVFTSAAANPAPGDWSTLEALYGSTVSLGHIDVSDAAANGRAFWVVAGANFQIHSSRIHDSAGRAFWLEGQANNAILDDLEIDHNSTDAILETTLDMNPSYNNIRMHDNGLNAILITGDYIHRNVTLDGSPTALNGAPIVISGNNAVVTPGNTLTITPGTTLKFDAGLNLTVQNGGTLTAAGTPTLRITFTSLAAVPAPGGWDKLYFDTSSIANLAYCDVAYAGVNDYAIIIRSPTVQIRQCRIHHSAGAGFYIASAHVTLINDAIYDNTFSGVLVVAGANLTGMHNTLARNGTGVYVDGGSRMDLTNTILANNTYGINVDPGGIASVNYTLWDSNTTPVQGVVTDLHHFSGPAAFAADGYHITPASAAAHRGMELGITVDIDGQPRPQPAHTNPDLGADEINTLYNFYLPTLLKK